MDGAILVTGASGFLGGAVARRLAAAGSPVVALGRVASRLPRGPNLLPLAADLARSPPDPERLPPLTAVLHFAYAADLRGRVDAAAIVDADLATTSGALDLAARSGARFLLASTGSLYGTAERPFTETDPSTTVDDFDGYLLAKLRAEELARDRLPASALTIFRMFFPYGPGMRRHSLFDRLLWPTPASAPIRLDGEDGILTNPIHVDDLCVAVERSLARPVAGTFNLGGPEILSLREIAERAGRLTGVAPRYVRVVAERPPMLAGNLDRSRRLLDWEPALTIDAGLRRCLASTPAPALTSACARNS